MSFRTSTDLKFKDGDVVIRISDRPSACFLLHSHVLGEASKYFQPLLSEQWQKHDSVRVGEEPRKVYNLDMFFDTALSMGILKHQQTQVDTEYELPGGSEDVLLSAQVDRDAWAPEEDSSFLKEVVCDWKNATNTTQMRDVLVRHMGIQASTFPLPARKQFCAHEEQESSSGRYALQKGWHNDASTSDSLVFEGVDDTYIPFLRTYETFLPELCHGPPGGSSVSGHEQALGYWEKIWQAFFHIVYGFEVRFRHPGNIVANVCFLTTLYQLADYCMCSVVQHRVKRVMLDLPGLWSFVMKEPAFMACLGSRLEQHDIFDDAVRHLSAQRLFRGNFSINGDWDAYYCSHELFAQEVLPELRVAHQIMRHSFEQRFLAVVYLLKTRRPQSSEEDQTHYDSAVDAISTILLGTNAHLSVPDEQTPNLSRWNLIKFFDLCKLATVANKQILSDVFNLDPDSPIIHCLHGILTKGSVGRLLYGFIRPVSDKHCRDFMELGYEDLDMDLGRHFYWPCENFVHYTRWITTEYSTFDGCWRNSLDTLEQMEAPPIPSHLVGPVTHNELMMLGLDGSEAVFLPQTEHDFSREAKRVRTLRRKERRRLDMKESASSLESFGMSMEALFTEEVALRSDSPSRTGSWAAMGQAVLKMCIVCTFVSLTDYVFREMVTR